MVVGERKGDRVWRVVLRECEGASMGALLACVRHEGMNNNVDVYAQAGRGVHGCHRSEDLSRRGRGVDGGLSGGGSWLIARAKMDEVRLLVSAVERRGNGGGAWLLASTKGTGCGAWPSMSARERACVFLACVRKGRRN